MIKVGGLPLATPRLIISSIAFEQSIGRQAAVVTFSTRDTNTIGTCGLHNKG